MRVKSQKVNEATLHLEAANEEETEEEKKRALDRAVKSVKRHDGEDTEALRTKLSNNYNETKKIFDEINKEIDQAEVLGVFRDKAGSELFDPKRHLVPLERQKNVFVDVDVTADKTVRILLPFMVCATPTIRGQWRPSHFTVDVWMILLPSCACALPHLTSP